MCPTKFKMLHNAITRISLQDSTTAPKQNSTRDYFLVNRSMLVIYVSSKMFTDMISTIDNPGSLSKTVFSLLGPSHVKMLYKQGNSKISTLSNVAIKNL